MSDFAAARAIATKLASSSNTDVLLLNADIERDIGRNLIGSCGRRKRRANIFLILVTAGGDPDAAYRIARCLQDGYEKFSVCISILQERRRSLGAGR